MIPYLSDDLDRLEGFVAAGTLLQVTAMSVTGEFGRVPEQSAWSMLREGWVHFVASDSHSASWRPPGLSAARAVLTKQLGTHVAGLLTQGNPSRILDDRPLGQQQENE
jgi:protein-tyrosine phosphatase